MEEQNVLLYIWLAKSFSFGSVMPCKIIKYYNGKISRFYENLEQEIKKFKITQKSIAKLKERNLAECKKTLALCKSLNINIVCYFDEKYPERLRLINCAPILLYYKGNLDASFTPCVSMVGTRNCNTIGIETTRVLTKELVSYGITTVSGCAKGIDSKVHAETLNENGVTISVLGTSLDSQYPYENKELKVRIVKNNGLMLSEYPPRTQVAPWHFPIRNRIISAISDCVIVVQSREKSGTIVTAKKALEFNKKLFFVPPCKIFNENSKIIRQCLNQGASLLLDIQDILNIYQNSKYTVKKTKKISESFNSNTKLPTKFMKFIKIVDREKKLEEILDQSCCKASEALFILTQLELLKILKKTKNGYTRY